jgi:hypothetical protein
VLVLQPQLPRLQFHVRQVKIHWCFDLPRRRLTRMAKLRGVHPASWCLTRTLSLAPHQR